MMIKKKSNLHVKVNELTSNAKADGSKSVEKMLKQSRNQQRKGLEIKKFIVFLLFALPCALCAQTEADMLKAIAEYNYELPIKQIPPVCGDSVLTPLRAQALKAMNRYSDSLKEWNSLLKADSTDVEILMELADCYKQIHRGIEASQCYARLLALSPENDFFRMQYIRSLLMTENYPQARDACHEWLEKDTISPLGYKYLAQAYEGMVPEDPQMLMNVFTAYNMAYRRDSLDGQVVASIAAIFNNNEQFADAVDLTERYRLSDTTNIDVNRQNAKAYCMLKDYKKAVNRYEALKQMGDRSFTTLYYAGMSHFGDNWVYGARDNLLEAHKKNPVDINVLYYLAKASARSSWKKEGVEYMEKALEILVPTDSVLVRMYDGLAECYELNQETDKQVKTLQKIYQITKDPFIFYKIAHAYELNWDTANAIYFYEKYMSFVPEHKRIALDEEGKPIEGAVTRYQHAAQRIERLREEDFFKTGRK